MKAGDIVQVQQFDRGPHWIYAIVITANEDGSAFVQIRHPSNVDDGKMLFFGAGKVRTGEQIKALLASDAAKQLTARERGALQSQLEWLS